MLPLTVYGIFAKLLSPFISIKKKTWVLGADEGKEYREGSKYLLEYMLKEHPDFDCCFITRSKNVYERLKKSGIPVEMNTSWKGIVKTAQAECVFTTQVIGDVLYTYKKKGRRYFYLVHGQPYKKAPWMINQTDFWEKIFPKGNLLQQIKNKLSFFFGVGYTIDDVEFVSATSEFLKPLMEKDFNNNLPVKILGMPRNDALFQPERFKNEKWIEGLEHKFVITYMPTHRAYGQGEKSPTPFQDRADIQNWMKDNNIVLVIKNHPNMLKQYKSFYNSDCIIDITDKGIDPQVAIYHSDVLVTDFSSVWMDYLLLCRPILFYIYDNFEQDDAGCHYNLRENPPGHFCYNENELFELIQKVKNDYDSMRPTASTLERYHKYVDGHSCERYFQEITSKTIS